MQPIKQLKEDNLEFYPITVAEGVLFQDGTVLADKDFSTMDVMTNLDINTAINQIFS